MPRLDHSELHDVGHFAPDRLMVAAPGVDRPRSIGSAGCPVPGPSTAVRARVGDARCPVVARILTFGAAGPDTPRGRFALHARPRLPSLRPDHEPVTSTSGSL